MNRQSPKKVKLDELVENPEMIKDYSIYELKSLICGLEKIDRHKKLQSVSKLVKLAKSTLEERETKGYRNQNYNGSELQSNIHECANLIEKVRASIFRNKDSLSDEHFDKQCAQVDDLARSFTNIANKIRNGEIPCKTD